MRLFDIPTIIAEKFPEKVAFRQKRKGEWEEITYSSYAQKVNETAAYLNSLGVRKGDKVGNLLTGSIEWNIIDMAVQKIGAVHVAILPNYNLSDYEQVINESEANLLIVGTSIGYKLLLERKSTLSGLKKIVLAETFFEELGLFLADQTIEQMASNEHQRAGIDEDELAYILYTSGTFNKPNGVMIHSRQIIDTVDFLDEVYQFTENDSAISYLPVAHAYERAHNYVYQKCGMTVTYTENPVSFLGAAQEWKPTFFCTVPMLLINIYNKIMQSILETDRSQRLRLLYEKFMDATGGRIRILSTAGAPLPQYIAEDLLDAGIQVWECYGATEAQIVCINSSTGGVKAGTVGVPAKGVTLKIAEDGEILYKSPYMTSGYYKNEALTRDIFDADGWYHSGDSGRLVDNKYLQITGRKRDIFKVVNGKYVYPEAVEKELLKNPHIAQVMVYGVQGEAHALIVPAEPYIDETHLITSAVATLYNDNVPDAERIMQITFCSNPWTIDAGELTPTMKLKREVIKKKYLKN